ncbi:UNVERIFIED_CONTAM: Armc9, partial [Trichonephila clavipes]
REREKLTTNFFSLLGKKRCEPLKVELISGLGRLLQQQDSKISPYVNGILYRILSIASVREYAKEQSLPNALRKLMTKTDGEPKKQLETILELFVTGKLLFFNILKHQMFKWFILGKENKKRNSSAVFHICNE